MELSHFLVLEVLLQLLDLIYQAFLIAHFGRCVLLDRYTDLNDMLLKFDSLRLRISKVVPRVLNIG